MFSRLAIYLFSKTNSSSLKSLPNSLIITPEKTVPIISNISKTNKIANSNIYEIIDFLINSNFFVSSDNRISNTYLTFLKNKKLADYPPIICYLNLLLDKFLKNKTSDKNKKQKERNILREQYKSLEKMYKLAKISEILSLTFKSFLMVLKECKEDNSPILELLWRYITDLLNLIVGEKIMENLILKIVVQFIKGLNENNDGKRIISKYIKKGF